MRKKILEIEKKKKMFNIFSHIFHNVKIHKVPSRTHTGPRCYAHKWRIQNKLYEHKIFHKIMLSLNFSKNIVVFLIFFLYFTELDKIKKGKKRASKQEYFSHEMFKTFFICSW